MKKDSLPQKLLMALTEKSVEFLNLSLIIVFDPGSLTKGFSLYGDKGFSPPDISRGFFNLEKYGFLRSKEENGKKKLYLTSKGRIEIIRNILKNKKQKESKWDGKWRGIIFDVPETSRRDRDFLRKELSWIGFKEVQKSVWIYPFEAEKELRALLQLWKMDFAGDIRFLIIEKMDDKDLLKYYNLS
jgi:phenylacetic acid degradation operon negative regulatory protein